MEQANDPEYPVITPRKIEATHENDENDLSSSGASSGPSSPASHGRYEVDSPTSMSSTDVNLDPRPITPGQQLHLYGELYANSPAHSCPLPGTFHNHHLLQPSIDSEPSGLPRYRVTDEDTNGMPWSFACGSALFGERLGGQDCAPVNVMSYSFDDTLVDSSVAGRSTAARSLATPAITDRAHWTPTDVSLRSGSFDGPVNFRTGMSGHTGLNVSRKKSGPVDRPHIRMMSEHRGIAARPAGNPVVLHPRRPKGFSSNGATREYE
jgi:hypothetical protein